MFMLSIGCLICLVTLTGWSSVEASDSVNGTWAILPSLARTVPVQFGEAADGV